MGEKKMKPFIPNDKFDVCSLHTCWEFLLEDIHEFDESYFSELAAKTFQLFYRYHQDEKLPKEISRLIPVMTLYQAAGNHPAFSAEDICKSITRELVDQLVGVFKGIKNPNTGRLSPAGEWFAVCYQGELYQIETKSFDRTPIKNKDAVKI